MQAAGEDRPRDGRRGAPPSRIIASCPGSSVASTGTVMPYQFYALRRAAHAMPAILWRIRRTVAMAAPRAATGTPHRAVTAASAARNEATVDATIASRPCLIDRHRWRQPAAAVIIGTGVHGPVSRLHSIVKTREATWRARCSPRPDRPTSAATQSVRSGANSPRGWQQVSARSTRA